MTAPARAFRQLAVALAVLVGVLIPAADPASAASLLAAVLTVAVVVVVVSWSLLAPAASQRSVTRHALRRVVVRPAQSDPDARGHARPRAPGGLSTAVWLLLRPR